MEDGNIAPPILNLGTRLNRHVARMEEMKDAYKILL